MTGLVVAAIFVLWNTLLIVPAREEVVKERLGKFAAVLTAGFHLLIPFIDRVAYRQERREQVIDIPSPSCITKDNIQVEVDGLVFLKVVDSYKASYGIANYRRASINLAQTTMRSEIGRLTLEQTFSEREDINRSIVKEINAAITTIATAIRRPGGALAVKMEVLEQFIEEFGRILEASDVSVVPAQLATLHGFFEGIGEVAQKLPAPSNMTAR